MQQKQVIAGMAIGEAAKYLGLARGYIYQLVHRNAIPFHKRPGGGVRGGGVWFVKEELDAWNDSGKRSIKK